MDDQSPTLLVASARTVQYSTLQWSKSVKVRTQQVGRRYPIQKDDGGAKDRSRRLTFGVIGVIGIG